jgi:hypothetical protein
MRHSLANPWTYSPSSTLAEHANQCPGSCIGGANRWLPGFYGRRMRYIRFPVASYPLVCHRDAHRDDRLPKDAAPLISLDLKVRVECHDAIRTAATIC